MSLEKLLDRIKERLETVSPGQRIEYIVPSKFFWNPQTNNYNWYNIGEIQTLISGPLQKDTFSVLRFGVRYYELDPEHSLTVDIYRL